MTVRWEMGFKRRRQTICANVEGARTGFRQCYTPNTHAVPTKSGSSWSASSCSGDEENQILACKAQWRKATEWRNKAQKLLESEGRKPSVQFEERSEEA